MTFKIKLSIIMLLLLSACGTSDSTRVIGVQSQTGEAGRSAVFFEVEDEVQARDSEYADFSPAVEGETLNVGGQAKTLDNGRARIDVMPEGTIVRMSSNSLFTLSELSPEPDDPITRIQLALGELWIILRGGDIEVETSSGKAAVRGSMMGVAFDDVIESMLATCLEGFCELSNALGITELIGGQAAEIPGPNQPPGQARPMTHEEFDRWETETPEADDFSPGITSGYGSGGSGQEFDNQPIPFSFSNTCSTKTWHWLIDGQETRQIDLPPGTMASGELPPGEYQISSWVDDSPPSEPTSLSSGSSFESEFECTDGYIEPVELPPPPPPGEDPDREGYSDEPIPYTLINLCPDSTWRWLFEGPVTEQVDIPPGETVSGELPPGIYTVRDWADNGHEFGPSTAISGGPPIVVDFNCPGGPPPDGESPPPTPDGESPPPPPE